MCLTIMESNPAIASRLHSLRPVRRTTYIGSLATMPSIDGNGCNPNDFAKANSHHDKFMKTMFHASPAFFFRLFAILVMRPIGFLARRKSFGLRWQSAAATPHFGCRHSFRDIFK